MLGFGSLVLCAGTVPNTTLEEKAEAAAAAGYAGLSVGPDEVRRAVERAGSPAAFCRMLGDLGLEMADLDALINWMGGGVASASLQSSGRSGWTAPEMIDLAASVGCRGINIVDLSGERRDHHHVVDTFAAICDRAAPAGVLVYMEFFRGSAVKDLATVGAIARDAGRPNGGALLDTWHYHRGRAGEEDQITTWAPSVKMVQMSDALVVPDPDRVEETIHRRLLPGMGAIPLRHILTELKAANVDTPIGVEVFSDDLARVSPLTAARLAAVAAQAVLDSLDGGGR